MLACPVLRLEAGERRFRVPDAALLVVEEGTVLVTSSRSAASRRMILTVAGEGSVLLPPVEDELIEAATDTRIRIVTPATREALLRRPEAAAELLDALGEQLRERDESLAQFSSVRHVDRVREKLLQLARTHGRVGPGGIRLDLPLTHELMGEMVGSARETVTWAFSQLAAEGFLAREGRSYRVAVPPEALAG